MILHQDLLEGLLAYTFHEVRPGIIGNEYLVVGTVERSYWRHRETEGTLGNVLDSLHDFRDVVIFRPAHYGWVPAEPRRKIPRSAHTRSRGGPSSAREDAEEAS